ncbi:MAG: hypothetical protein ABEJ65_07005, partial [bacterium]
AKDVKLSYRVHAPDREAWFSTDFPIVEGSVLMNGTVIPANGQQMIEAILPIRGTYLVQAQVEGPEGTTSRNMTFSVSENSSEIRNLIIFL